jgi:hypothetical protein
MRESKCLPPILSSKVMEDDHSSDFWNIKDNNDLENITLSHLFGVTPGFNARPNAHSMCTQESSLHIYHTKMDIK